jgi:hypothetical protein
MINVPFIFMGIAIAIQLMTQFSDEEFVLNLN